MTPSLIGLVEDDDHDHFAYERAFAPLGSMRRWRSGEELVAAITEDEALLDGLALLIVDLNLEGIDGVEVTRRVRGSEGGAALPILVLTGSAAEDDIVRALEAEASEYEVKPDNVEDLHALVERSKPLLRTGPSAA